MTKHPDLSVAVETPTPTGVQGYVEFEIDIEVILRERLPITFEEMPAAPLTAANVAMLPEKAKGAYLLLLDGTPVYAGKTDTRHGFRDRLKRHADTIHGRTGLEAARLTFKALRILVFSAFDVEAILINELKKHDRTALPWNYSGFGSNDPGRNRDGQQPAKFDLEFPIDVDFEVEDLPTGSLRLDEFLNQVKQRLPYTLRTGSVPRDARVFISSSTMSVRDLLNAAMRSLPPGWQATVLHGRIVIYHEQKEYEYKLEVIRS